MFMPSEHVDGQESEWCTVRQKTEGQKMDEHIAEAQSMLVWCIG